MHAQELTSTASTLWIQARAAHTAELASRTELQGILRQCVEDVRAQQQALQEGSAQSTPRARTGCVPHITGAMSHE